MIGKKAADSTAISTADAYSITVRGRDLTGDLMGRLGFTEYFFLLTTGREPTDTETEFLDLLLVAIAEHGLVPTNQAARMTLAADPGCLQGAVAAGILGCGSVILGTAEACGAFLTQSREAAETGKLRDLVLGMREAGQKVPGFGHPVHKPLDPRAERILDLAEERGAAGPHVAIAHELRDTVHDVWGKPLTMNVSMAIAAVLLDLDFPRSILKGVPILARTASLLAHLAEESDAPIGFYMAHHAEEAVRYAGEKA